MKNNTANRNKGNQPYPKMEGRIAEMEWFKQFDHMPGIEDAHSSAELNKLKGDMLTNIKNEINKID